MSSIVHMVSFLLLTFAIHLLVNCNGMAVVMMQNNYIDVSTNLTARNKAEEHFRLIEKRICSSPVPKLYPVDDIYPILDGNYKPHCVELFRCNNDAGCCKSDSDICTVKETETVHLLITRSKLRETKILLMPFENHTKCECRPLSEVDVRGEMDLR